MAENGVGKVTKELDFIDLSGHYGGSQEWLPKHFLRLGACAATTACEICACLAQNKNELKHLYPYDSSALTKADFVDFDLKVAKYLYPRISGVDTTGAFAAGFRKYADSAGIRVDFEEFQGTAPLDAAIAFITKSIDGGYPVAYLMLRHKDRAFNFFNWHWFTVTGYETADNGLNIICGTFGKRYVLPLEKLYDTGYKKRGGMVVIK